MMLPPEVTPIENRSTTPETTDSTSCDQKLIKPRFLRAVPSCSRSLSSKVKLEDDATIFADKEAHCRFSILLLECI
jgi:hypothetical protein